MSFPFGAWGQGTIYTPERPHQGQDWAPPGGGGEGAPIYACADGVATAMTGDWYSEWGRHVRLHHPDGSQTGYAHCATRLVEPGDVVSAGQVIATVGRTGLASAPHLHLECWRDGVRVDPASSMEESL